MEDTKIIELYEARSERAIAETASKYGAYLDTIAFNILQDREDAEECVSDTYLKTWNAIPPKKPSVLRTFIGKITRNLALDQYDRRTAQKRGGGEVALCLDELEECLGAEDSALAEIEGKDLAGLIDRFLENQKPELRKMFVRRYWYLDSIHDVSEKFGCGESRVKTTLFRMREELREYLESEGVRL